MKFRSVGGTIATVALAKARLSDKKIDTSDATISELQTSITLLEAKINNLALAMGVVFNSDGAIQTNGYAQHTHTYTDVTIADTSTGGSAPVSTNKTTGGIN